MAVSTADRPVRDWGAKGAARVVQNVRNLLLLVRYEVAYNRTLGLDPSLTDLPAEALLSRYAAAVADLIDRNEPRASVERVDFAGVSVDGQYDFEVVLDIVF